METFISADSNFRVKFIKCVKIFGEFYQINGIESVPIKGLSN